MHQQSILASTRLNMSLSKQSILARPISRRRFLHGAGIGAGMGATTLMTGHIPAASADDALSSFIAEMPKAELHVHIEGTVDPTEAFRLARRNGSPIPYESAKAFEEALNFTSLESFLKGFHDTIAVLQTEEDFYDVTSSFLKRSHEENVLHVDIKFDPQAHARRGISFDTFFNGIRQAQADREKELGITSQLIMCFQRDASLESAEDAFTAALKYQEHIVGIGLDNTEILNFPAKFADIFGRAREAGFKLTSHCDLGQPNGVEHIRACIEDLKVDRLDHGYNILEDERLVQLALDKSLCFTACPTSAFNTPDPAERFYFSAVSKAVRDMLALGLRVTINTDDPGVMGNRYLNQVFIDTASHMDLNRNDILTLTRNAFQSLWIPDERKQHYLAKLLAYEQAVSQS